MFEEYVENKIKEGKDVEKFMAQEEDGTFLICFKGFFKFSFGLRLEKII